MPTRVALPEMGEGVTDATVVQWLKSEGDRVEEFEALVEVNTDKVDTEVASPVAGTVLKILLPADTVVAVNQTLCWVGDPGEEIPEEDSPAAKPAPAPATQPPEPAPKPSPPPPAPKVPQPPAPLPAPVEGPLVGAVSPLAARIAAQSGIDPAKISGSGMGGMVLKRDVLAALNDSAATPSKTEIDDPRATYISPVVSRLAAQHGIDLNTVAGTGLYGQITKYDIQDMIEGSGPSGIQPHPAYADQQPGTIRKHTPVRRSIAKHMVESRRTSPHVSTFIEADLSQTAAHRAGNKDGFARRGVKLTYTAYFVMAAAAALRAYPVVNSSWSEEGLVLHPEIHIGMAVSLDADGLIVPVIRNAGQMTLIQAAQAVNDLAGRARNKQLAAEEVRGGTFTITNHGTSGSLFATPIINQPQCAILGVGAIQKRPVVVDDALAIRPMVYLSLTFDHRILDGAVADYFLQALRQGLEKPAF